MSTWTPDDSLVPLDQDHLDVMTDGDREFAAELIEMYRIDTRQRLEILRTALDAMDWERVEREAHTIKGASSNVGTSLVRSVAFELEKLGHSASMDGAGQLLEQLIQEFARAEEALQAWLSRE